MLNETDPSKEPTQAQLIEEANDYLNLMDQLGLG